ncbi:hypothetical protein GLOIN_2v1501668 [Rhizophagus irregularis DAOM 181602=DAOM 197198]|nr:hypothetical protein GLOIN_2v1501668 [Rhizophagus irregularis DAOM 181602=DAOM 197198]
MFHQKEIESLDYSRDKDDSDESSSVDPDKRLEALREFIDLLRDIAQAQLDSCLYTTCFIGVKRCFLRRKLKSFNLFDARVGVGVVNYPPFMSMKFKSYRIIQQNVELEIYGRITADDSGWKIIMTDELNQARLPLFAGILDISGHFENEIIDMFTTCDTGAIEQLSVYVALGKNSMLTWIWKRCWVSKGLLRWRHLLLAYILHFWPKQTKAGRMQNNEPITDNASVSEIYLSVIMKTSRNKTSRNITRQEGHINWMLNSQDPNPLSFFRHICPANRKRSMMQTFKRIGKRGYKKKRRLLFVVMYVNTNLNLHGEINKLVSIKSIRISICGRKTFTISAKCNLLGIFKIERHSPCLDNAIFLISSRVRFTLPAQCGHHVPQFLILRSGAYHV